MDLRGFCVRMCVLCVSICAPVCRWLDVWLTTDSSQWNLFCCWRLCCCYVDDRGYDKLISNDTTKLNLRGIHPLHVMIYFTAHMTLTVSGVDAVIYTQRLKQWQPRSTVDRVPRRKKYAMKATKKTPKAHLGKRDIDRTLHFSHID